MACAPDTEKIFAYMLYAAGVCAVILSAISSSPWLALLSAALLLASVVCFHSGHLINTILIRRSGVIIMSNGYRLSGTMHSLAKSERGRYKAVSVAVIRASSRVSDQGRLFAEIIEKYRLPFEFSIALTPVDRKKVVEDLQTRLQTKEILLSHTDSSDYAKANSIKREMELISNDLSAISGGNPPMEAVCRVRSFAFEDTEAEASRSSLRHLEQLCLMFSSHFGSSYTILSGEDLIGLL